MKCPLPVATPFCLAEPVPSWFIPEANISGFIAEVDAIGASMESLTFSTGESVKEIKSPKVIQ